jgi:hypothetical protein
VLDIAMAIDTYAFFLDMELMGDFYDPDAGQVRLFPFKNSGMTAQAAVVHQIIAGGKLTGDDSSRRRVAIRAGNRRRVGAGRKPPGLGFLILMAAQTKKRMGRGKTDHSQSRDGGKNQDDRNDQYPGSLG